MDRALGSLDDKPRARLGHSPTPLEAMNNLAEQIGGGPLYVKRDDCTGLALGGNKVRQLEFYFGEAQASQADTILITGAVQSNFARLAAASARKLGMDCHIQHEARVPKTDPAYLGSGNVLLEKMLGATLHDFPEGEDEVGADARLGEIASDLRESGQNPYIIHLAPGHPPLGALGYVDAARELVGQMADEELVINEIVVASGSGHTHGGLLFGLRALGCMIPVTGVCVRRDAEAQAPRIAKRCLEIADLLGIASPVAVSDIRLDDRYLAPGYGQLNDPTIEAIEMAARCEGLILDPVYTGKTMAGFLRLARDDAGGDKAMLFTHTGGAPAVFGYGPSLTEALLHE